MPKSRMIARFCLLLLLVGQILSCGSPKPSAKLPADEAAFRSFLQSRIPIGTTVMEGERRLAKMGFDVRSREGALFVGMNAPGNFLHGDLQRSAGLMVSRRYQVALVHSNGNIFLILATTGLVGP